MGLPLSPCPELGTRSGYPPANTRQLDTRQCQYEPPFLSPGVFSDVGLRTASGLVARVSGKVDVPGRTEAAGGPHHRLLPGLLPGPEPPAPARYPAHPRL